MRMSYDDQYLFTVSEDACLFIFKAVDKEGRGMKRDKEVGYAEEILITKSDLEEKVRTKKVYFLLALRKTGGFLVLWMLGSPNYVKHRIQK